jgi:hypothetical protein
MLPIFRKHKKSSSTTTDLIVLSSDSDSDDSDRLRIDEDAKENRGRRSKDPVSSPPPAEVIEISDDGEETVIGEESMVVDDIAEIEEEEVANITVR